MIGLGTWSCGISTPLVKDKATFTISDDNGKYKISLRIKNWDIDALPIISAKEFGNTLQLRVSGEIYKPGTYADGAAHPGRRERDEHDVGLLTGGKPAAQTGCSASLKRINDQRGFSMKLKKEFFICETDGDSMLVPTGKAHFSGLVKGNKTLGAILDLLQKDTSEAEIIAAMKARFDAPEEIIVRDVSRALAELRKIGALDEQMIQK